MKSLTYFILILFSLEVLADELAVSDSDLSLSTQQAPNNLTILRRHQWEASPSADSADINCYTYSNLGSGFENLNSTYSQGRIVIHHTAEDKSIKKMQSDFLKRGWTDVPYHYLVDVDGKVYEGRPLTMMGAHAGYVDNETCTSDSNGGLMTVRLDRDYDFKSIGIALRGMWVNTCEYNGQSTSGVCSSDQASSYSEPALYSRLHSEGPQFQALSALILSLVRRFSIKEINSHKHIRPGGTLCPGGQVIELLNRQWADNPRMSGIFQSDFRNPVPENNISSPVSCNYRVPSCSE